MELIFLFVVGGYLLRWLSRGGLTQLSERRWPSYGQLLIAWMIGVPLVVLGALIGGVVFDVHTHPGRVAVIAVFQGFLAVFARIRWQDQFPVVRDRALTAWQNNRFAPVWAVLLLLAYSGLVVLVCQVSDHGPPTVVIVVMGFATCYGLFLVFRWLFLRAAGVEAKPQPVDAVADSSEQAANVGRFSKFILGWVVMMSLMIVLFTMMEPVMRITHMPQMYVLSPDGTKRPANIVVPPRVDFNRMLSLMTFCLMILTGLFTVILGAKNKNTPVLYRGGTAVWYPVRVLAIVAYIAVAWFVTGMIIQEQQLNVTRGGYLLWLLADAVVVGLVADVVFRLVGYPPTQTVDSMDKTPEVVPVSVPVVPLVVPEPVNVRPIVVAPSRTCPKCQAPVAADALQGLCPKCLLGGAFGSVVNPSRTAAYDGPFEPPTVAEVQEFFPFLHIDRLIGQGGMGAVYLAKQKSLDRTVAVKLIRPKQADPTFAERFVREAKAMAKLSHPNIVSIHESGEAGGSLYLIMEYVDGGTLREGIRGKVFSPTQALRVVGQLCDALEYAHRQGVVHRDIKPENILLDTQGNVKVADFGLAKVADGSGISLTRTHQAMGTPHYMAPEQWEKPAEVDHRADIYALGVVIYELLTGELPLGRFDPPSVKAHVDARLDDIVLRLLAKEPNRRYQQASDVRTALQNFARGEIRQVRTTSTQSKFYEYKSKTEFWGWPLVHVVSGIDPRTNSRRIAKGWIAIGDLMAIGLLALGGVMSVGMFSISGVFSLGLLALGGNLSIGGISIGGMALGFVAVGGLAAGWLSIGGLAAGRFVIGGAAAGKHVISGSRQDADFLDRLTDAVTGIVGG